MFGLKCRGGLHECLLDFGLFSIPHPSCFQDLTLTDTTGSTVPVTIWMAMETKIGIVCACLPTLLPLFHKVSQAIRSELSSFSSTQSRKSSFSGDCDAHQLGEPIVILDPPSTRIGCPNCNCPYCDSSRANSNSEVEKLAKKQESWYSAALRNWSEPETRMHSESPEEIAMRARTEGDHFV